MCSVRLSPPPSSLHYRTRLLVSFFVERIFIDFLAQISAEKRYIILGEDFLCSRNDKNIASQVCRMPRSSDTLARSLSAFEYLSSTRPAASVFSNNCSSQAKRFRPSSSRPLHCCLPTLHRHCDSKCQIKYCSLPQHNRYRSRGRRLVFARAQVNKCTCTLAQHSRDH